MGEARSLAPGDPEWPERFAHLGRDEAPKRVFVRGTLPRRGQAAVAVVGSRRPTPAGLLNARDLGFELGAAGIVVISGLARGVDSAAHVGALDAGGVTVAVLGCGIDRCYPPENRRLRDRVVETGAVVSEDAGDEPPLHWRFPRRNRLIAALCEAVVVVEASEKSGALSTARRAIDLGREVLAVPGSIRTDVCRGTNQLIRDGARPYLGIGDLFEAVPALSRALTAPLTPAPAPGAVREPDVRLRRVLEALGETPLHPDDLAVSLGLSAREVSTAVTTLRLRGAVTEVSGGRIARTF